MSNRYLDMLTHYWGYEQFRPLQEDIVRSAGDGHDTLALMPTGGGKSITFQVPALAREGLCLVITPLIALMKDQIENLKKNGIKAAAIHSGLTYREIKVAFDNAMFGGTKFLYVSPERLLTDLFQEKITNINVNLIAVDEAHCISQWGYDFRPSYLKIADIREYVPNAPILALTATATPRVVDDIMERLKFAKPNVFRKSFLRDNLAYVVRQTEDKEGQLIKILKAVTGSAIVYVRSRKKTREYAALIQKNNIGAEHFHAGLAQKTKDQRQENWKTGRTRVMVATNAFGMGIDKPDVRLVVHIEAPDSLEAYFQEAGRAGRDNLKAYAVLLWSNNDKVRLKKQVKTTFPEPEAIKRVYEALGNFFQLPVGAGFQMMYDFDIGKFCSAFKLNILQVFNSLKILQRAGYITFTEELDIPSKVMFLTEGHSLYKFQVANKELDPTIKILLRSYTGLFMEYASINETHLAKKTGKSQDDVYQALTKLNKAGIIHYIPRRKTPLITYTRSREELRHLRLPPEVYAERKKHYEEQIHAVIEYGSSSNICRSRFLLNYFGESNSKDCGICDVCIARKKKGLNSEQFRKIENAVKTTLQKQNLSGSQLVEMLNFDPQQTWKVLQWLEDHKVIGQTESGHLQWLG
ncbi:MAG: RecQ family ATP-dependent DNA helicase [Marinilabiliaceae bacterium]